MTFEEMEKLFALMQKYGVHHFSDTKHTINMHVLPVQPPVPARADDFKPINQNPERTMAEAMWGV